MIALGMTAGEQVWPLFVAIIGVLALVGVLAAFYHTHRYKRVEAAALQTVKGALQRLQQQSNSGEAAQGAAEVRQLIAPAELMSGLPSYTLIAERLTSIDRMRSAQVKLSVGALQQMTLAKEATRSWMSAPGLAANLSMLIGLLGTVVGLTIMVQLIDKGLPADVAQVTRATWQASVQNLHEVLGGMRTAFAATMAGVIAAITLAFLNHRLARAQSMFIAELDRFTAEALLPAVVVATEDQSVLEQVSLRLETGFTHFDTAMQANREMLQELNAVGKGVADIISNVRQTTRTDTSERMTELMAKLGSVIEQMGTVNQTVLRVTGTLPKMIEQMQNMQRASYPPWDGLYTSRPWEERKARRWPSWPVMIGLGILILVILSRL